MCVSPQQNAVVQLVPSLAPRDEYLLCCPQLVSDFFSAVSTAFKLLESSSQKFLQGLVYLIGNLLGLALAVYKCQSMGLLPTHASDWLAFIEPPEVSVKLLRPNPKGGKK